jgi:hypothetical protein
MKLFVKIALVSGVLALACGSAALAAGKPEGVPQGKGQGQGPVYTPGEGTPGPKDGLPAKAKAYGRHCQGESKKHIKGEKGTAFSRCVKAVNDLRKKEREEEKAAA